MLGFSGTREWVYPQSITGRFTTLRRWAFLALHLILFVTPWLRVGGKPLLLIDIPARQVFLFGAIFTASDSFFLMLILLFAAFALFFFTSLWGRLWCGYACPQTVFLETWIRPLEIWIEGDRVQRKRRDGQDWSFDRAWRKVAKWAAFLAVSILLATAIVSFFVPAWELWTGAGRLAYSFVLIFTALWYLDFTWFREQFCNFLCPYARFQSALTDDETLLIGYDPSRGEPRKKGKAAAADGRCIECSKCVVVCPQGIDIRDGFQMECIQCARCIDACTSVMDKLGHRTLVEYTSMAEQEGRTVRRLRPRTLIYAGLLMALLAFGFTLASQRVSFEATVNRVPGSLFTVDPDGFVRNTYLVQITNNTPGDESVDFVVTVEGLPGAEILAQDVQLASTETRTLPLIVRVPQDQGIGRTTTIVVRVVSPEGEISIPTTFKTGADVDAGTDWD